MMELNVERWSKLMHAYGSAEDIPALLQQLRDFPAEVDYKSEPYFSLWSALCHQGDVYSASYAAVPHIVDAMLSSPSALRASPLQLVVCIELARANVKGPPVPADLVESYTTAIRRLAEVTATAGRSAESEYECRLVAAALAVSRGHIRLAEAIIELEPDLLADFMNWVAEQ
jgi:hypothetical protein